MIKGLAIGGAERLLLDQVRFSFDPNIHYRVMYLSPNSDALVGNMRDNGADVQCLHSAGNLDLRWVLRLRRQLLKWPTRVVHSHGPYVACLTRLMLLTIRRRRRPAHFYTEHNLWTSHHPMLRVLNRLTTPLDTHTYAVSGAVAKSMSGGGPRVEVLHHGIDAKSVRGYRPERKKVRDELGVEAQHILVGSVANLRSNKAYPMLIEAAYLATPRNNNLRFVAVGGGALEDELRSLISARHLDDRFRLLGTRQDALRIMSAFDIFTLSSVREGLPIALLEAMAMGLPVVATKVGGIPEAVGHAQEGLLVDPGDPEALAEGFLMLAQDPTLRRELGKAAELRAQGFDTRSATRQIESAYSKVGSPADGKLPSRGGNLQ